MSGWFKSIQNNGDVSKTTPTDKQILQYNSTTRQFELIDKGTFASTDAVYLGDPLTAGTWRVVRNGNDLNFERYEGGIWVEKGSVNP